MSSAAIIAFLDIGLEIADRLTAWRMTKAQADAEGRDVNMDDVRLLRSGFDASLNALDIAIAAAEARESTDDDQP